MTPPVTQHAAAGHVRTILIADDDEKNLYVLKILLTRQDYRVVAAATGAEALQAARQNPPDLIISDILMPVMDGFALCREWRQDERLRGVPFIFYTATYTEGRDRDFALGLGADRFLVKPAEPEVLLRAIQETLAQSPSLLPANADRTGAAGPKHVPIVAPQEQETVYLKQYNAALIRKLETKMTELERTNRELERDIAARQQAESTLRLRDSALQAAANAIVITDPQGNILWTNPAFTALTGYTDDEVRGQNPRLLKSGHQDQAFYQTLWNTILAGRVWRGEMINRHKRGHLYSEETTITPVHDAAGRLTHFIGVKQDVTERHRLTEALRESEATLRGFFDSAGGMRGIVEVVGDDVVHVSDNAVAAIFHGQTKESLRGKRDSELGVPREVTRLWLERLAKARESGAPAAFDYTPHQDDDPQWLFATVSFLGLSAEGHPRFAYVTNDITHRKRAEEELRQSREQLRALLARLQTLREDERTQIAREIHDELGQQLTGLKMDLRWIERHWEDWDDPRANVLLDRLVDATGLVDATIKTVQRIATELRPGVLDHLGLIAALRGEVERFQERTGVACQVQSPADELAVPRDVATTLFRIFQEALTNVARHSGASEVRVRFEGTDQEYLLEVSDNGRGISDAALRDARSLGLLGMQERVRLVGGEVSIHGEPGRGTAVRLRVPVTHSA